MSYFVETLIWISVGVGIIAIICDQIIEWYIGGYPYDEEE